MEAINRNKAKIKTAKSQMTKSTKEISEIMDLFVKARTTHAPKARVKRLAGDFLESLHGCRQKLAKVREIGEQLTDSINDQAGTLEDDKIKEMIEKVEEDMDDYSTKLKTLMEEMDGTILLAETELSEETAQQGPTAQAGLNNWRIFRPNQNLKPRYLEKDSNALDVRHFTAQFQSYILDGFQGEPMIKSIPIQLQPLVEATWWQSLVQRGIQDNKTLEQVTDIIAEESEARNPIHQRRIELLRVKKADSTHSDFLYKLEQYAELSEFSSLTLDGLISHLFLEQSDQEMGRICQEILAKEPGGNLKTLRSEIKRAEGSVWYKGAHRNTAKRTEDRYCGDCDSITHNKKDCWGACTHCGKRNHRSSDCNKNKRETEQKEKEKGNEEAKAKKALVNKKKKEKRKEAKAKKKAERAQADAKEEKEASNTESEASEEDSPVQARKARLERVGLSGAARRAISFQNELLNMSEEESTELATSITSALARKAAGNSSPVFKAEVTPTRTAEKGRMEDLVADTGCTKNIVGADICRDNCIKITPLEGMKITDAAGNYLNISGTAEFFVKSQVLGARRKRVRAAVLEGNNSEREILISLELLQKWDLVHPSFPMETVSSYILSMNKSKK